MKNEDLDLLELQELALKNKSIKRHKSLDEKLMIVKAHLLNHVPISQLSKEFGISIMSIYRWISTFADGKVPIRRGEGTPAVKPNPSSMSKKNQCTGKIQKKWISYREKYLENLEIQEGACTFAPQTLEMIEQLSAEPAQQK